jgi:DNA polymerase-3 subunit epsilon
MVALAESVDVIETPTIIEAEIRELRMISAQQPRFNRRSRFQEKAIWVRLSQDNFPRLVQVRGVEKLTDNDGWCGPFNGREEANRAIEAIHEVFPIRQCSQRITVASMKRSSPCALLGIGKCGAPCVGAQSLDSYGSLITEIKHALHEDLLHVADSIQKKMEHLALTERFEEAADLRDRLAALVRGSARGQRIRAFTKVAELAFARPGESLWEIVLIRYGRLAGSMTAPKENLDKALQALLATGEVVSPKESILPASTHEEVEVLLRFINHPESILLHCAGNWVSPIRGSGRVRAQIESVKSVGESLRYKELFANVFDNSRQR